MNTLQYEMLLQTAENMEEINENAGALYLCSELQDADIDQIENSAKTIKQIKLIKNAKMAKLSCPVKKHEHIFRSRIAFDFRGESTPFGLCWCGEKDA